MEFPENELPAAPDPDPTTLAPLDSASPDSAISESSNDDAQQLLDSLVTGVLTAGTSLPSSPSLSSDDELTASPKPKPRRAPRTKSRRKSASRHSGIHPEIPQRGIERAQLTFIERHARKCAICRHPERQQIDESFLHWRSPQTIMHCFGIKTETTIYHHAHAFNFFALRNRNLQSALANVVENIDTRDFTGREMLDAVRALAHLGENGRWIHPTSKSEFMYSMQRLPAAQAALPAHANALSAGAGGEILIASRPIIKKRCKPLKTILTYPF